MVVLCYAKSIVNKKLDLHAFLVSYRVDILAITETFLSEEILDSEMTNGSYAVFRRDRDRHGGGVMIMIRNNIPAIRRPDLETSCEVLWIELPLRSKPILLGVFYRPPISTTKLSDLRQSLNAYLPPPIMLSYVDTLKSCTSTGPPLLPPHLVNWLPSYVTS